MLCELLGLATSIDEVPPRYERRYNVSTKNERLKELVKATKDWEEKRTKELTDQAALAKKMLQGRTGSDRLAGDTVSASSSLVVDEIAAFMESDV